ncbi:Ger(x)C family spore germination protein [Priestia sp. SIMBA_032]|uniref:Ger(x)C family spore germination protein n=1 Tax=Priestia sp. SIMBA_032 TaxID=3085775 RepID=UPI00397975C2
MKKWLITCLSVSIITGCSPSPTTLEDLQFVQSLGYDYVDKNSIKGSFSVPVIQSGMNSQPKSGIFTATAQTSKDLGRIIQSQSQKPIETGRLGVALYGKELANKKGIFEMLDSIYRDPRISKEVYLAVVEGEAYEMLNYRYPISDTTSKYLIGLIEQNAEQYLPKVDVHTFMYQYFGKGLDPFMPLLERKGDKIQIKGISLFKGDKYIDYIGFREAFLFKMLYEDSKKGFFNIKLDKDLYVSIENISSSVKYKVRKSNTNPKFSIYLKLKGRVVEGTRIPLGNKSEIQSIEKEVRYNIKKRGQKMVSKFQKLKIDPLGIGDRVKSQTRKFDFKRWEDQYPKIPIELNVDVQITQTMSIE